MKTIRIVLLPLILASIIALFSITGCGGGTTPTGTTPIQEAPQGEFSQQQLQQILTDALTNQAGLNTYNFDMSMDMVTDIIGGAKSGKMTINTNSSGGANLASNQMQITMEMEMSMEGLGYEDGSQSLIYDIYQVTDWIYMKMEIPGAGEQWMKMPVSDKLNEKLDLVDQQMGPLESAVQVELLRYENVDGIDCYVLSIIPDMDELTKWISEQQGAGTQDIDWADISNLSDMFKELEYTCYVTMDSNLMKKLVVNMEMELTAEQAGVYDESYDKMTMNISVDMTIRDYNEPFSVILPDEAENATQVAENMFF